MMRINVEVFSRLIFTFLKYIIGFKFGLDVCFGEICFLGKAVGRERSRLLKQYYVARRQGDYPESKKVFKDMLAFSKKHPSARINYESLKRSYKGHQRTTAKMHNGTTLSPMMKRVLEEQRKEYDTSSLFD